MELIDFQICFPYSRRMSKLNANTVVVLGHCQPHMGGENVQVQRFSSLLQDKIETILDVFEFFGEDFASLARLNYALIEQGDSPLSDVARALPFLKKLENHRSDTILLLSFCFSLAALLTTGIHKKKRILSKFHVHHPQEKVFPTLYEMTDLLLTESLLANLRGAAYGLPESKFLYFPHHYPPQADQMPPKPPQDKITIGVVSRFERGKNCEFALEAVRKIVEQGRNVELILMGDFAPNTTDSQYQENFHKMLLAYEQEPWFKWEKRKIPYKETIWVYNRFDLCLQLSGAEAGSNIITELLGMGKPVIALNASTNPYLFKGGAFLIQPDSKTYPGQLHYQIPDLQTLVASIEEFVKEPKKRKEWGENGKKLARDRFHIDVIKKRVPLLFDASKKQLQQLYDADRKAYGF